MFARVYVFILFLSLDYENHENIGINSKHAELL